MGRHQVQVHAVIKNFLGLCSSSSGGTGTGTGDRGGGRGVNEVELLQRRRTVCTAPHNATPVEALPPRPPPPACLLAIPSPYDPEPS